MMHRLLPATSRAIARQVKISSAGPFPAARAAASAVRCVSSQSWAYERLVELGKVDISSSSNSSNSDSNDSSAPLTLITEELLKTPSPKVSALVDEILLLNVVEVHALYKVMEQVLAFDESLIFGGGGGGGSAPAAEAAPAAVEKVVEKTSFDVKIGAVDAKVKIKVIKEVRAITGLGLKEAKDLVEKAPVTIKEGLKKEEAEQIMKVLAEAGAEASMI